MKKTVLIVVEEVNREDVARLFYCGGIGYWGDTDYQSEDYEEARDALKAQGISPSVEDVWAEIILSGKEFWICDTESDDKWLLTVDKIKEGYAAFYYEMMTCNPGWPTDEDDFDSTCEDAVIQFALFGEIVFG